MIRKIVPVVLPLALVMCQGAQPEMLPDTALLTAVASPNQSVRNTHPRPVVTDYTHREPVDPKTWRDLNQDQAPIRGTGS